MTRTKFFRHTKGQLTRPCTTDRLNRVRGEHLMRILEEVNDLRWQDIMDRRAMLAVKFPDLRIEVNISINVRWYAMDGRVLMGSASRLEDLLTWLEDM